MISQALLTKNQAQVINGNLSDDPYRKVKLIEQKLQWLPLGDVVPTGWLRAMMLKDMEGFTGHLDQLVPDLMNDMIYGTDRLSASIKTKSVGNITEGFDPQYLWWNSETQSNWRDGYIRNSILLNNPIYLQTSDNYIQYLLSTQDEDGYLGIYAPDLRYQFKDENGELWAKTTALRGLMAWYEYTANPAVLNAIVSAVENVMVNYPAGNSSPFQSAKPFAGGLTHGLVFTDILDWLYQITGNEKYMDYALFLYQDFSENNLAEDAQYPKITDKTYKNKEHGVHTYEHLRPLTVAWMASGNEKLKSAVETYLEKIEQCTTPAGGPIGDEWVGGREADATETGYEYCSLQEMLDGYTNLIQKTGEAHFGDLTERLFFNAAMGARHPNESSIAYCKTDNSYAMTGTKNGEKAGNEIQTRFKYSPAHQDVAVCCVPNAGRIIPYFVRSMWLKDADGLVSALLGPSSLTTTINQTGIQITEETNYPFSNTIDYSISVEKPLAFTLKIRKPEWADHIKLNCDYNLTDGFIIISKVWNNHETIHLELVTEPKIRQNNHLEKYITFGALVFAAPVESQESITKTYATGRLFDKEYKATQLKRYRFPASGLPSFNILHNNNQENPWKSLSLTTRLLNEETGSIEPVKLIPLGATILRQETFKNETRVSSGRIHFYTDFPSAYTNSRNINIWLPEGYTESKKYSVLYMHDGQMLFDSTTTWNHQSWKADEVSARLMKEAKVKDFIIVGIWNGGETRHPDYFPQKPYESLNKEQKDYVTSQLQTAGRTTAIFQPISDNYLKFIVKELKPFIDQKYATLSDRDNTFIAGSSMGGLISMYALCEYPDIFGGAACLSTHWPGIFSSENNPVPEAFASYMRMNLPDPKTHKIYFDYGDQTLDALYPPLQKEIDNVLKSRGYTEKSWITRYYPGKDHSEKSWSERLEIPLIFLLGNNNPAK